MFTPNSSTFSEVYDNFAIGFIYNLQNWLTMSTQIKTVDEIVTFQQINFCAYEPEFFYQGILLEKQYS